MSFDITVNFKLGTEFAWKKTVLFGTRKTTASWSDLMPQIHDLCLEMLVLGRPWQEIQCDHESWELMDLYCHITSVRQRCWKSQYHNLSLKEPNSVLNKGYKYLHMKVPYMTIHVFSSFISNIKNYGWPSKLGCKYFYLIPLILPGWDSLYYWFYLLIFLVMCNTEETAVLPRGSHNQISSATSVCKEEDYCNFRHKLRLII